jgi:hypothetical protein
MARPSGVSRLLPFPAILPALSLLVAASAILAHPAAAQLPAAAEIVPPGFVVSSESDLGGAQFIEAKKKNESCPAPYENDTIQFKATWTANPMAQRTIDRLVAMPEDPADSSPTASSEPCGREGHEGGVLICRKATRTSMGAGEDPDRVTYSLGWVGATSTGLVGLEVTELCGGPSEARGWIDAAIAKVRAAR